MKKFITMLLALTMLLTLFAGCGGKDTGETTPEENVEATTEATNQTTNESATEESTEEIIEEETAAVDTDSLEGIIEAIYAQNPVEFGPMTMAIDLTDTSEEGLWMISTYTGLMSPEGITEAVVSEAMIGSIPYSLCLVRAAEGYSASEVADAMKGGIDQRKWICVEADDLMVVAHGDIVMLVMIGSNYGTAQSFVDAFAAVVGEVDYTA